MTASRRKKLPGSGVGKVAKRKAAKKAGTAPKAPGNLCAQYRPQTFAQVLGNPGPVKALRTLCESDQLPPALLFKGPAGVGKTTLARLVAASMGAEGLGLLEVDAASHSGVDNARELAKWAQESSLLYTGPRCLIVDECHRLSKQAWDALLKPMEDPSARCHWLLCTTDPAALPRTVVTRCNVFALSPVDERAITDLLSVVISEYEWPTPEDVVEFIASECGGSPRAALKMLEMAYDAENEADASARCEAAAAPPAAVVELCRWLLTANSHWPTAQKHLKACKTLPMEEVRLGVVRYMATVTTNASPQKALRAVVVADAFSNGPWPNTDGVVPLARAIAEATLQE